MVTFPHPDILYQLQKGPFFKGIAAGTFIAKEGLAKSLEVWRESQMKGDGAQSYEKDALKKCCRV